MSSPFLEKLSACLDRIAQRKLVASRRPSVWRAALLVLEEERMRDWRKTRVRLERYALLLARKLAGQEEVSRIELADLSTLIAAWAAVQRVAGLRYFAICALQFASGLAERTGDLWAQGYCLQKAAYLTQDGGRGALALSLVDRAALCFSEAGTADDLVRILIDRGFLSYQCGRLRDAQRMLESGLRKIDPHQKLYVVTAHLSLARIYRGSGDRESARRSLLAALDCPAPRSAEAAFVSWEAAKLESEFDDLPAAEKLLQESLRIFGSQGRAGDFVLVALDYAEILLRSHRRADLERLIVKTSGRLERMARPCRALGKPFENLAASLAMDGLGAEELEEARQHCRRILARRAV